MSERERYLIKGFGFSNFRSVGENPVFLYPLKKINVLIGPNNSGKTNILSAIQRYFTHNRLKQNELDNPNYNNEKKEDVFYPVDLVDFSALQNKELQNDQSFTDMLKVVLQTKPFFSDSTQAICWKGNKDYYENNFYQKMIRHINGNLLERYAYHYYHISNNSIVKTLDYIVGKYLENSANEKHIDVVFIEALRDLYDNNKNSFLGDESIIEKLKYLSNPRAHDNSARHTMRRINAFVSEMLEYKVRLYVPDMEKTINIQRLDNEDIVRNLSQIGSGIQEMIYIAIVATLKSNQLICIDEPEIHLHPRLLRKLIKYLEDNTDCQYIFSTHSNCFLDSIAEDLSVFCVSQDENGYTKVKFAASASDLSVINNQLGNRASELLQSNCIIWVEGPSDRLYINYWIKQKKPSLVEGIDYSIMFYGGRLLKHLTAEENPDSGLIKLLDINRNSYIVMDRDRDDSESPVNDTKKRIIDSFPDSYWLTSGREIENYLPYEKYKQVLLEINSGAEPARNGSFLRRLSGDNRSIDKVEFAQEFTSTKDNCDFTVLDLDCQINKVVDYIIKANR